MKKITKKEYDSLFFWVMETSSCPIIQAILSLKLNEALLITKKEWKRKTNLSVYLGNIKKRSGKAWKIRSLHDKSGWAILRVK